MYLILISTQLECIIAQYGVIKIYCFLQDINLISSVACWSYPLQTYTQSLSSQLTSRSNFNWITMVMTRHLSSWYSQSLSVSLVFSLLLLILQTSKKSAHTHIFLNVTFTNNKRLKSFSYIQIKGFLCHYVPFKYFINNE